jgi:hypothetical protein
MIDGEPVGVYPRRVVLDNRLVSALISVLSGFFETSMLQLAEMFECRVFYTTILGQSGLADNS